MSAEVVIRAPSVDDLFDPWDPAPVNRRALDNDARERIVEQWVEHQRDSGVNALVVLRRWRALWTCRPSRALVVAAELRAAYGLNTISTRIASTANAEA